MADTFTETTTRSYGSRLKDSIAGVLVGVALFFGSFVVLFWNESNSVKVYKAIAEMEKNVISVPSDKVDAANEGRLVCTSGMAVTSDILKDTLTGLSLTGISLSRNVEMYQWVETKHTETKEKVGGSEETVTTYTYDMQWSSSYYASSNFKQPSGHTNPLMEYKSREFTAENVKLGAFKLTRNMIGKIGGGETYALTAKNKEKLPVSMRSKAVISDGTLYYSAKAKPAVDSPRVGDYRFSYSFTGPKKEVSVMAKQVSKTFEAYTAKNGKSFEILKDGIHTAAAIIAMERQANAIFTWIFRAIGFIMMFIGLTLIIKPLRTVLAVLPFLAKFFDAVSGFALFVAALILSLVTIAIAWVVARPIVGIGILVVVAAIIIAALALKKKGGPPNDAQKINQ